MLSGGSEYQRAGSSLGSSISLVHSPVHWGDFQSQTLAKSEPSEPRPCPWAAQSLVVQADSHQTPVNLYS